MSECPGQVPEWQPHRGNTTYPVQLVDGPLSPCASAGGTFRHGCASDSRLTSMLEAVRLRPVYLRAK